MECVVFIIYDTLIHQKHSTFQSNKILKMKLIMENMQNTYMNNHPETLSKGARKS